MATSAVKSLVYSSALQRLKQLLLYLTAELNTMPCQKNKSFFLSINRTFAVGDKQNLTKNWPKKALIQNERKE